MAFFWPLGIGGMLFFAGTCMAILSHFHHMQVMVMMMNLFMAVLLLHWPLALFVAFSGTCAAVFFFTHHTGSTLPVSALGSIQMIYCISLFASLLIALKGRQVYRGLVISHAQLREDSSFTSQMFLSVLRHQARLQQEANIYPLAMLERTESLHTFHQTPTKAQLMANNAALHQHVYALDTLNKHLQQMLHLAQEPIHLVVETVSLTALWQDVLKQLYQHKAPVKVFIQHNTTTQSLRVDVGKVRKLLLTAVSYAVSHQKANQPVFLSIEDTQLVYPLMSIPGYIKRVQSLCIALTTEESLPKLKKWYVGNVEHPSLRWPHDREELTITHNQQIVAAHYGASEVGSTSTGVTQVYVLPIDVGEIRPATMNQWQMAPPVTITSAEVFPRETIFVKQVLAKTRMDRRLLGAALQLIKQYHAGVAGNSGGPFYLYPIAVAHILLDYTQDPDTLLAALLHATIDTTCLSWPHIALRFNPTVQRIVEGVSSVDSRLSSFKKIQLSSYEIMLKLSEVKDNRVLYVKLADRLHNMRTIAGHTSIAKQKKIAEETFQFFVPMATNLGLKPIAEELKKQCLVVLNKK
jgi:HD domain